MAKSKKAKTTTRKTTAKKTARRATTPAAPRPQPGITPYLAIKDAAKAIDWYKSVFGAKELTRQMAPGNMIMHADLKLVGSRVFVSDIFPGADMTDATRSGTPVSLSIYDKSIQKLYQKAVDNGAKVAMPLAKQFWGDWYGKVTDPFGHSWAFNFPAKMTEAEKTKMREEAMRSFGAPPQ